jgi:competence protein ComGB
MASFRKRLTSNILSREQPGEKGLFLKRIGMLLEEGYSMKDALSFLAKIEKGATKSWIISIQDGLLKGGSFHEELEVLGFSSKVSAQIYLASQFGNYGQAITQTGEQLLAGIEKQKKLKSLTAYPLILTIFLVGMLLLMRFLILPQMESLFASTGSEEDVYANGLVMMVYYSPQIIIGSLLLFLLLGLLVKKVLDEKTMIERITIFMKVPFVQNYLKDYYTQFFFFEWGNLFQNGSSFQEIVMIMQGEEASKLLQETGQILSEQMKLGNPIHESLEVLPFFHEEALHVITHGESLGKLSTEMLVYASYCENQLNVRVEKLMGKIQPLIFIFIALMIISIYGALMLPIFSLMEGF